MPTKEQCRSMIFKTGLKLGVSPKLIAERLLSDDDKEDMLEGRLKQDVLEVAVKVWKDNGMPDYRNAKFTPYALEQFL